MEHPHTRVDSVTALTRAFERNIEALRERQRLLQDR
jgi:hypothetical protein